VSCKGRVGSNPTWGTILSHSLNGKTRSYGLRDMVGSNPSEKTFINFFVINLVVINKVVYLQSIRQDVHLDSLLNRKHFQ
jgi:hypothetical protein